MKAIEPSEILGREEPRKKTEAQPSQPWVRFVARFFDYSLLFMLLIAARSHAPYGKFEFFIPYEFFIWIPIEAFLLSTLGTTPGKFLLKIKLRPKLDFMRALRRSFSVWFRGLGMGIPVINILCLLNAFQRLRLFHVTSWDKEDHITVTQQPVSKFRRYFAVFVAVVGCLFYYGIKRGIFETGRVF